MTDARIDAALEAWFESLLDGQSGDPTAFARAHGIDPEAFGRRVADAAWLVGRHREVRQDDQSLPTPPFALADLDVLEEAGRGGMGVVFRAHQRSLDRQVAVKIRRRITTTDADETRFLREARAAARLDHPNIVRVLFVGQDGGLAWYAMEWIEGQQLSELVRAQRVGTDAARHTCTAVLIAKVARALQHAHEHGVLHRDVKPANILVDTAGEPHLADFGIAKDRTDATLTATGALVGSLPYMSPEQLSGCSDLTPRSDVFALGVTLFECLTGSRPFTAGSVDGLRREQLADPMPEPRRLDPTIHVDLQWICQRALTPEPGGRYPSAAAMAADLEAFVRGEAVQAGPPTLRTRMRRLGRRHRGPLRAAALATLAVALAAVPYFLMAGDVEASQREIALARLADARLWGDARAVDSLLPELLAAHPDDLRLRMLAALHHVQHGRVPAAERQLVAAGAIPGADAELIAQARAALVALRRQPLSEAEAARVEALAGAEETDAVACWLRGEMLRLLHRWDACVRLLRGARRLDPRLGIHVANSLVDALSRLGEHRTARDEALAVAQLRGAPEAFAATVRLDVLCGDRDRAQAGAAELRTRFPLSPWNVYCDLLLLDPTGDDPREVETLLARAQADPRAWSTVQQRFLGAAADLFRRRGAPQRAIEIWRGVAEREPENASVRGLLGSALLQLADASGDPAMREEGIAELKRAGELGRGLLFEEDIHLGTYWYYAGEPEQAAEHFAESTRLLPGHPSCWRQLAGACLAAAARAKDADARIDWLTRGVAAQQQEVDLAPRDERACGFLTLQLTQLHQALEAAADPRAPEVKARLDEARVQLRALRR